MRAAVWLLNDPGLVWNEGVTGSVFFTETQLSGVNHFFIRGAEKELQRVSRGAFSFINERRLLAKQRINNVKDWK